MNANGWRWGLVTFALGLCAGTLGHYLNTVAAALLIVPLSVLFAFFGGLSIAEEPK